MIYVKSAEADALIGRRLLAYARAQADGYRAPLLEFAGMGPEEWRVWTSAGLVSDRYLRCERIKEPRDTARFPHPFGSEQALPPAAEPGPPEFSAADLTRQAAHTMLTDPAGPALYPDVAMRLLGAVSAGITASYSLAGGLTVTAAYTDGSEAVRTGPRRYSIAVARSAKPLDTSQAERLSWYQAAEGKGRHMDQDIKGGEVFDTYERSTVVTGDRSGAVRLDFGLTDRMFTPAQWSELDAKVRAAFRPGLLAG